MGKLTSKQVENLKAAGTYQDGDGLRLVVKESGRKSWVFRFQIAGKRRDMGLGSYPEVGLADARKRCIECRKLSMEGLDPMEAKKVLEEQKLSSQKSEEAAQVLFEEVAEDYIDTHKIKWKTKADKPSKTELQWRSSLATYAYPIIGKLTPAEITTDAVLQVLRPIWKLKPETASRVRNRIELILDAAKSRKLREGENPARWRGHLSLLLPERSKVRAVVNHPSLPWRRLPEFIRSISEHKDMSAQALKLAILTACRTSEVLEATWQEFDMESGIWIIPAIRMKATKEHRVPLSPQALALLKSLPRFAGNAYVFPSVQDGKRMSNMAMLMKVRGLDETSMANGGKGWRDENDKVIVPHGFRSTFRDWAAEETSYSREVIEMSLAHTVAKGAEAAYWRSDMLEKRRALMNDWADFVMTGFY